MYQFSNLVPLRMWSNSFTYKSWRHCRSHKNVNYLHGSIFFFLLERAVLQSNHMSLAFETGEWTFWHLKERPRLSFENTMRGHRMVVKTRDSGVTGPGSCCWLGHFLALIQTRCSAFVPQLPHLWNGVMMRTLVSQYLWSNTVINMKSSGWCWYALSTYECLLLFLVLTSLILIFVLNIN